MLGKRIQRLRAFTVAEAAVTMALVAVLMAAGIAAVSASFRAQERTADTLRAYAAADEAYGAIADAEGASDCLSEFERAFSFAFPSGTLQKSQTQGATEYVCTQGDLRLEIRFQTDVQNQNLEYVLQIYCGIADPILRTGTVRVSKPEGGKIA